MKKILIITTCLFSIHTSVSGYTLMFGMDDEIKKSKKIGEIIIHNLSYRLNVNPSQLEKTDTIVDEITYSFVQNSDSQVTYKTTGHAYWPFKIGDTVLTFFDEKDEITLLAEITKESEYRFWVPYHQWRYNTIIFSVNSPFKADNKNQQGSKQYYDAIHKKARDSGYEFGFLDHCRVNKVEFWKYFEKIKNTVTNTK